MPKVSMAEIVYDWGIEIHVILWIINIINFIKQEESRQHMWDKLYVDSGGNTLFCFKELSISKWFTNTIHSIMNKCISINI